MSLRARLLVGMAVVGVVLVVAAVVITRSTESYLVERVDAQLAAARSSVGRLRARRTARRRRTPAEPGNTFYFGDVDGDDVAIDTRRRFALRRLRLFPPSTRIKRSRAPATRRAVHGRHRSAVGHPVSSARHPRAVADGRIVAALSLADVDASVSRLIWVEVIVTGLVLGILGARHVVGHPPRRTSGEADDGDGDSDRRWRSLAPCADRTRGHGGGRARRRAQHDAGSHRGSIRRAIAPRRRGCASSSPTRSHELRTPVATIRGYAELYRRGGLEEREELRQAMRRTEAETLRMGSLIDDLLLLARLDQGRPLEQAPVDLGVLAVDAAADARAARRTARDCVGVRGSRRDGDEHRLRQLVATSWQRARHTPPTLRSRHACAATTARCARGARRRSWHVARRGRAFERFYRATLEVPPPRRLRARTRDRAAIVDAHGGTVPRHRLAKARRCACSCHAGHHCGRIAAVDRPQMRMSGPVLDAPDVARSPVSTSSSSAGKSRLDRDRTPAGDGWSRLAADRSTKIEIQFEEHYVRPVWPGAPGAQGCSHLDIWVECPRVCVGDACGATKPSYNRRPDRAGCGSCSIRPAIRSVSGHDVGRDLAEATGLEVLERLHELLAGVHHERSVRRDRLPDRLTPEDENVEVRRVVVLRLVGSDADRRHRRRAPRADRTASGVPSATEP